ncbi:serine/threonine-protein kinase mos [Plakobranchus ocellatus]|uniref:non-specific serine/threonine protein kinase n=1 Tax=Plakobranchus ocellatus TaxID=259542 RepID=A0AAV3YVU6_9GAST|nr:serine/threonine-protein kinase mos [Plakobranchus ocellatus]
MPVAIKVVQKRRGSGIHREVLQAERLAFSLKLRHENIVHILGVNVCDDLRGDALIVMELVSSRTLQCLLDDVTVVISPGERLRLGMEVSAALSYLHSHQLVHLDVKPKNVLVGEDVRCKLADFGNLTRTKPGLPREDTDYTQLLGTLPYRAPELMKGQFPSCKADIYSLGITLWQMASRETPHSGANPHWLIYQVTKANKRPASHDTGDDALEMRYCELYRACWDAQPGSRPEAEDAHKALAELREVLWECGWREASYSCSRLG